MSKRPTRAQLGAQLADRCDEISRLRAQVRNMVAERDEWHAIARALLVRNAELSSNRVEVIVTEPKTTGRKLGRAERAQVELYQRTRGEG